VAAKKPTRGNPAKAGKSSQGGGKGNRKVPPARFGVLVFGVLFVALFLIFAIGQGLGNPSIPSNDIAVVKDAPDTTTVDCHGNKSELSHLTKSQFSCSLKQSAARAGLKTIPKPGSSQYTSLKDSAVGDLLDTVWIQSEAEEQGVTATPKEVATQLAQIKQQNFKTKAEFQQFLKTSGYSKADVDTRVKLQILSQKIEQKVAKNVTPVSDSDVHDYYDAAKTQFTQPASRDVRVILNKDKAKVEQALALLQKDDSAANWKKVAAKYSTDPASKTNGGLRPGVTQGLLEKPIDGKIFSAPLKQVDGVVHTPLGYYAYEVEKITPEQTQPFSQVQQQIKQQLDQQNQQNAFQSFVNAYGAKWQSRTFCATGFVTSRCSNFKTGHPQTAPPTCYEAHPKGGRPDACPAPVQQVQPALPGTVTLINPQGTRLAQRPHPPGGVAAQLGSTIPGGALPGAAPTGAAPPTGAPPTGATGAPPTGAAP
jgi:parvulin-like peptidyl-prolyl isomerase